MNDKRKTIQAGWNFDNTYSLLPRFFYKEVKPVSVSSPQLIIINGELARFLGLNVGELESSEGLSVLAGNSVPDGSFPIAQAYAGHQFGYFTMLGDGRAILIGEQITPLNERYDIQLKGSGKTPFSRGGDGRAPLGPMLREYIISEAMHSLGIPTTRSLAVVATGDPVFREVPLSGAILTRTASSHIRVGTFQYASAWGTVSDVKILADYTINRHFKIHGEVENPYVFLLNEVIRKQAMLIAKWQLVGFIHGVMNTDNMSICGETIDYGPCAFMDKYDENTFFSSIDLKGRYSYSNQPEIAKWNLARFAETLLPLLNKDRNEALATARDGLSRFSQLYDTYLFSGYRSKLGLYGQENIDRTLIQNLLNMMKVHGSDYTNTFRALTLDELSGNNLFDSSDFSKWFKLWQERLEKQGESSIEARELMAANNPALIPRNHRVEEALYSAVSRDDFKVLKKLIHVLSKPYAYSRDQVEYSTLPPPSDKPYRTFCGI